MSVSRRRPIAAAGGSESSGTATPEARTVWSSGEKTVTRVSSVAGRAAAVQRSSGSRSIPSLSCTARPGQVFARPLPVAGWRP